MAAIPANTDSAITGRPRPVSPSNSSGASARSTKNPASPTTPVTAAVPSARVRNSLGQVRRWPSRRASAQRNTAAR